MFIKNVAECMQMYIHITSSTAAIKNL